MKNTILACLLFMGFTANTQSLQVNLSKDSILLGNSIKVEFIIENSEGKFEAPKFEEMDILSGPNYSSSMQIINGAKSSKRSISYILRPRDIGKYYIPPAYLIAQDIQLNTEALEFNVYPNPLGIIEDPKMENNFIFESFQWPNMNFHKDDSKKLEKSSQSKAKIRKI